MHSIQLALLALFCVSKSLAAPTYSDQLPGYCQYLSTEILHATSICPTPSPNNIQEYAVFAKCVCKHRNLNLFEKAFEDAEKCAKFLNMSKETSEMGHLIVSLKGLCLPHRVGVVSTAFVQPTSAGEEKSNVFTQRPKARDVQEDESNGVLF